MTGPEPMVITICNTCKLPWSDHIEQWNTRILDENDDSGDGGIEGGGITYLDCLRLTQAKDRGPQGVKGEKGDKGDVSIQGMIDNSSANSFVYIPSTFSTSTSTSWAANDDD